MSTGRCVSSRRRLLAERVVSLGQFRGCFVHRTGGSIGKPRLLAVWRRRRGQRGRGGRRRAAACRRWRRFNGRRGGIFTHRCWRGSALLWSRGKRLFSIVQRCVGLLQRSRRSVPTPGHWGRWRRSRRAVLHTCRGAVASSGGTGQIRKGRSLRTARLRRRDLLRGTVGVFLTAGRARSSRTSAMRVQCRPACRTISYGSQFWDATLKQASYWLHWCRRTTATAGHASTASFRLLNQRSAPVIDSGRFLQPGPFADVREQSAPALGFISAQLGRSCVCLAEGGWRRGSSRWRGRGRNGHLGSVFEAESV